MSIRLGTSITRSRRAYDRRLRGVGAASDATKTDPSSGGLAGGKKTRTPPVAGTHGGVAGRRANAQRIRPAGYFSNLTQTRGPAGQRRPVALLNVPEDTRIGKGRPPRGGSLTLRE